MLYYFILLAAAAAILLVVSERSESNRWAAFFLISASLGGVAEIMLREPALLQSARIAVLLNHTMTPYGVAMFSMAYADIVTPERRRWKLKATLFLPAAITMAVALFTPGWTPNYQLLLVWTVPYYLTSCIWLVRSFLREKDPQRKRNRLITVLITVPTLLAVILFINIARALWPEFDFFRYISVFIVYSFALAMLCVFLYGVLGVKVRVESDSLQRAMTTAGLGTGLLNHSIKNEVGKIAISVENLRHSLAERDGVSQDHLRIIEHASAHLLDMAGRIHSQTKEFAWQALPCSLEEITERCLTPLRDALQEKGILLVTLYEPQASVRCDPVHLQEAIGNILSNAIDAMPNGGVIELQVLTSRKDAMIHIRDTGAGIPPESLKRVWEPFYSLKSQSDQNYGLGLSYVYQVMRKCGGYADIASELGAGTRVTLHLPRMRRGE